MEKYECKGLTRHRVDAEQYLTLPVSLAPGSGGSLRAALSDALYKLYNLAGGLSAVIETVVACKIKTNASISQIVLAFGHIVDNAHLEPTQLGQVLLKLRWYKGEAMKGVGEREVTVSARATDTLLAQAELRA